MSTAMCKTRWESISARGVEAPARIDGIMNAIDHCQIFIHNATVSEKFFKMTMTQTHCQCRKNIPGPPPPPHSGTLSVGLTRAWA